MKLYTIKTTIFLLPLLLINNVVYCGNTGGNPPDKTQSIATNSNTNYTNYAVNTKTITPECLNIEICENPPPLTRTFGYTIDDTYINKLKYPNRIEKIRFNDYIMEFDYNVKLPNVNIHYISLYTCQHYNPLLMYMYGNKKFYFYALDPNTNKWNNHIMKFTRDFRKYTDENGVHFYRRPNSKGCLSFFSCCSCKKNKYEAVELSKELCKVGKCVKVDITMDNDLVIYMKYTDIPNDRNDDSLDKDSNTSNDTNDISEKTGVKKFNTINNDSNDSEIIIPILSFTGANNHTLLTARFVYEVDNSDRIKLSHPNTIDKILFNVIDMEFDSNAKLPSINISYIYLYTCHHFNPLLICLYANSRYYYYSLDPKTNKWNNYTLKHCKNFTVNVDDNGVNYYSMPNSDLSYTYTSCCRKKYSSEDKEIAKKLCKKSKCVKLNIYDNTNTIISLKYRK